MCVSEKTTIEYRTINSITNNGGNTMISAENSTTTSYGTVNVFNKEGKDTMREIRNAISVEVSTICSDREGWEQLRVIILATFEEKLLDGAEDYDDLTETQAYDALMDAVDHYIENPGKDYWFGECPDDSHIIAQLEPFYDIEGIDPCDDSADFDPCDDESEYGSDIETLYFIAWVYDSETFFK